MAGGIGEIIHGIKRHYKNNCGYKKEASRDRSSKNRVRWD
jgi:hypothetical protein